LRLRRLIILLLVVAVLPAEGQLKVDSIHSQYVKTYRDHFFVWPVFKRRRLAFDMEKRGPEETEGVRFLPNNSFSVGVGAHLFDVSFELSAAIPLDEKNQARYGESTSRDLTASVGGSNWGLDGLIQNYKGFYMSNPEIVPLATEPYPVRPDVEMSHTGIVGIYAFNKNKYSLWSSYTHSERQLKSAGSLLLAGAVSSFRLQADSVILSTATLQRLASTTSFFDMRSTTLGIGPGYGYSFVYGHVFFNLSISVGPAHHWIFYRGSDGLDHYDIALNSYTDSRVSFGYNSDRFFTSISFVSQTTTTKVEDLHVNTETMAFRFVAGYRFKEKGFLAKTWRDAFPQSWQKYIR
jgi:hypothetical protein